VWCSMNEKIILLKAKIDKQLVKLEISHKEMVCFTQKMVADDIPDNPTRAAIGYYLHNFYNGCENIFRSIAQSFENNIEADQWHRELLMRMTLDIQGIRPAVIDEQLYMLLDDFRGFRHAFRNCYSFELDWTREKIVLDKYEQTWRLFNQAMRNWRDSLDALI
jgi:hypothetical protein